MGGEVLEVPTLKEWKEAEARGMQQGGLNMLFGLVRDNMLTAQTAADRAKLSLAAFNAKMAEHEAQLDA